MLIATTAEGLIRKAEQMKGIFRKLSQNKIKIKIAAPLKSDKAKEAAKEIKEYAEVKDINMNTRFMVVDGKELIFMVNHDKETHESADVAIWVKTPFFANTLREMF